MKCPDCGAALSGLPLSDNGSSTSSFRCGRCGGWWVNSNLVNTMSSAKLAMFPKKGINSRWMVSVGNKCPVDNTEMILYRGDAVPDDIHAKTCPRCGWWWFGGESLYNYKEAADVKIKYARLWGSRSKVAGLFLPLTLLAVLVWGLVLGVKILNMQTRVDSQAAETGGNKK